MQDCIANIATGKRVTILGGQNIINDLPNAVPVLVDIALMQTGYPHNLMVGRKGRLD